MPKAVLRNIDYFSSIAGLVIVLLYSRFPTPQNLGPEDFDLCAIDPDEEVSRLTSLWADTIHWLTAEKLLRYDAEISRNGATVTFEGLILTKEGFRALTGSSSRADTMNIAEALTKVLSDMSSLSERKKIDALIQEFIERT